MTKYELTPRQLWILMGIAALGIVLRFVMLDRSFWFDELATIVHVDGLSWLRVLHVTAQDLQPPLYNSSVLAWSTVFGFSEIALRSLSLIFGLTALATPWLARTSLSRTEKLVCCGLMCVMSLPIKYAQEARNYSLLLLLSSACVFLYFEQLHRRSRVGQILLHGCLVLLAFSHLFGMLLALSFLGVMFLRARGLAPRLGYIVYAAALGGAVLIPLYLGGIGNYTGGKFWIKFSAITLFWQIVSVLTPVGLLLLGFAAIARWRVPNPPPLESRVLIALAPFALMFAGAIAISLNTPILDDRNLIGLIPAYSLLIASLLKPSLTMRRMTIPLVFLSAMWCQSAAMIYFGYMFIREDFRDIARQSIARNAAVCYLVPDGQTKKWSSIMNFYVERSFKRSDLAAPLFSPADLATQAPPAQCALWAEAHPEGSSSLLRSLHRFDSCSDIPLQPPAARVVSVLVSCPRT